MKRRQHDEDGKKSTKKRCVALNLKTHGIEVIRGTLETKTCQDALVKIKKAVKRSRPEDLGDVHGDRIDVPLSLHYFYDCVRTLLNPQKQLAHLLKNELGGDALLVEFAAMIASPESSVDQPPHIDSSKIDRPTTSEPPHMLTVFVALQDVSDDMGPLEFWPGTHLEWNPPESKDVNTTGNSTLMTVNAGNSYVLDSRAVHRGLANVSSTPRTLLYFTFQRPSSQKFYSGSTYTIRSDYLNKFTLTKLQEILQVEKNISN
jgi:ectoine hydroxylase-related dioxygenase (phytanoyl-CoA dioxygenase family)